MAAGAGVYAAALGRITWDTDQMALVGCFGLVAFLSFFLRVKLQADHYDYTLDDIPLYALIFLHGWPLAVAVMAAASFAFEIYRLTRALLTSPGKVRLQNLVYSFANPPLIALWAAAAGALYGWLNGDAPLLASGRNLVALPACAVALFALASTSHAVAVALRRRQPLRAIREVVAQNYSQMWLHLLMLAPLGALLAIFVQEVPAAALLLVVPVVMLHTSLDTQRKLLREAESTVQAMATYLDERDHYTLGHSERVAGYARATARHLGLSPAQVERVHRAGLIHDIGKIDVPDAVLRKRGPLTEEERAIMRTHTQRPVDLGHRLLALRHDIPFDVAAYHHEHYDGRYSTFGLKGEEIPLPSRILAVADTYDAMTSDRPYRRGMEPAEALVRLRHAAGTQLDPKVVEAFMAAFEAGEIEQVAREWNLKEAARAASPDPSAGPGRGRAHG
ncbi:MAG TPA: HD-GYP domain-containing protein [Candidatus Nitrosotenuis sp.]|jgi:HD-GYP domain-containing protein (c-di-GMP phosphodiesterase class II)|nr:HD-GYP domain-containing protein [Candidatus Nitrosotenuis sp.]